MVNFAALSGTDYGRSHSVDFCQWTSLDSSHGGYTLDLGSTFGFFSLTESGHLAQSLASQVSFASHILLAVGCLVGLGRLIIPDPPFKLVPPTLPVFDAKNLIFLDLVLGFGVPLRHISLL